MRVREVVVQGVAMDGRDLERWVLGGAVAMEVSHSLRCRASRADMVAAERWEVCQGFCAPIYGPRVLPRRREPQMDDDGLRRQRPRESPRKDEDDAVERGVVAASRAVASRAVVARAEVAAAVARSAVVRAMCEKAQMSEDLAERRAARALAEKTQRKLEKIEAEQSRASRMVSNLERRIDSVSTTTMQRLLPLIDATVSALEMRVTKKVDDCATRSVDCVLERFEDLSRERQEGLKALTKAEESKRASEAATVAVLGELQREKSASLRRLEESSNRHLEERQDLLSRERRRTDEFMTLTTSFRDLEKDRDDVAAELERARERREADEDCWRRTVALTAAKAAACALVARSAILGALAARKLIMASSEGGRRTKSLSEKRPEEEDETGPLATLIPRNRRPSASTAVSDVTLPTLDEVPGHQRKRRDSEVSELSLETADDTFSLVDAARLSLGGSCSTVQEAPETRPLSPNDDVTALTATEPIGSHEEQTLVSDGSTSSAPRRRTLLVQEDRVSCGSSARTDDDLILARRALPPSRRVRQQQQSTTR